MRLSIGISDLILRSSLGDALDIVSETLQYLCINAMGCLRVHEYSPLPEDFRIIPGRIGSLQKFSKLQTLSVPILMLFGQDFASDYRLADELPKSEFFSYRN